MSAYLFSQTERTVEISLSASEQEEYQKLETKAQNFYRTFRSTYGGEITKHFLKISQKLLPLRVASSGGTYPIEEESVQNSKEKILGDTLDSNIDDVEGNKKKNSKTPRLFSKFAFTSKFKTLIAELKRIRDSDPSRKYR